MNHLLAYFSALALTLAGCSVINPGPTARIDGQCKDIEIHLSEMRSEKVDIWGESTEGGEATAFKDSSDQIRMIRTIHYGETGKSARKLYFENGQLIHGELVEHRYNKPIYMDAQRLAEMGIPDAEPFDPDKSEIKTYRYYFADGKLIQGIGPEDDPESTKPYPHRDESTILMKMAKDLQNRFREKSAS